MKSLAEIKTISEALSEALKLDNAYESVGFLCMWEEYRRTKASFGEPCFGLIVRELLVRHGIDLLALKNESIRKKINDR